MKNFYLKNKLMVQGIIALALLVTLIACGGGGAAPVPLSTNTAVTLPTGTPTVSVVPTTPVITTPIVVVTPVIPAPVVYTPGTKNPGGITYTAGTGSVIDTVGDDKDVNANGVPDRVETGIQNMYPGTTTADVAKREALMESAKEYTVLLSLTNDKLPTTKAEAIAITNSDLAKLAYCKFSKAFSLREFESTSNRIFLMNVYSREKMKRYLEIGKLSEYPGLNANCN